MLLTNVFSNVIYVKFACKMFHKWNYAIKNRRRAIPNQKVFRQSASDLIDLIRVVEAENPKNYSPVSQRRLLEAILRFSKFAQYKFQINTRF